jgi:hypothetical protein
VAHELVGRPELTAALKRALAAPNSEAMRAPPLVSCIEAVVACWLGLIVLAARPSRVSNIGVRNSKRSSSMLRPEWERTSAKVMSA